MVVVVVVVVEVEVEVEVVVEVVVEVEEDDREAAYPSLDEGCVRPPASVAPRRDECWVGARH